MAEKDDKKLSLGETIATIAIAAIVMWMLYEIKKAVWSWATASPKRAWICVPIILWPLFFVGWLLTLAIVLSFTGLLEPATDTDPYSTTPQVKLLSYAVPWMAAILAATFSIIAARRVVRKMSGEAVPPEQPTELEQEERSSKVEMTAGEVSDTNPPVDEQVEQSEAGQQIDENRNVQDDDENDNASKQPKVVVSFAEIERQLSSIDEDDEEKRANVIKRLSIPKSSKRQLEFLFYCDDKQRNSEGDEKIAWRRKAKGVFDRLRIASHTDSKLVPAIAELEKTYSDEAVAKAEKQEEIKSLIYGAIGVIIIALCIYGCRHMAK